MAHISFNQVQYDFAAAFFSTSGKPLLSGVLSPTTLTIEVGEPSIALLLNRIREGLTAIMPYVGTSKDTWMIAGANRHDLDKTLKYITRFLIPTYAEITPLQLQQFDATGNALQQAGTVLYPTGYYRLASFSKDRDIILNRLALWLNLETRRPSRKVESQCTYRNLAELFQLALSAANWSEAEQYLYEIQRLNLSTAENLAFLRVQLLAQQQRWTDIWQLDKFDLLAKSRVPRLVRSALLTAFHHSELLPREQQGKWDDAFAVFKQNRSKLGKLLIGRFGITHPAVVQVFAYQAVLDADHASLESLRQGQDTPAVQTCLDNLYHLLPPIQPSGDDTLSPQQQIKQAFELSDYDTAIRLVDAVADPIEQIRLLVEIMFYSGDIAVGERALLTFWDLPAETQQQMRQEDPSRINYLDWFMQRVAPAPTSETKPIIGNWVDWFEVAQQHADSADLVIALDHLGDVQDDRVWTTEQIIALNEVLFSCIDNDPNTTIRNGIQRLTNAVIQESEFPRAHTAYQELYETLHMGLLETQEPNENTGMALLRFTETLLHHKPSRCESFWQQFQKWIDRPLAALESVVLEIFELLVAYGLPGGTLTQWYRMWVEYLIALPSQRDRASLETWHSLGEWMQTVPDLVDRLQQSLTDATEEDQERLIEQLPAGYQIGMFSLCESSAQRAKQMLESRNSSLDVRICTEKDLNDHAKSLAQNADLVVVVWTCISHALTYGIGPYLKRMPVYPQSRGSTSIVRAIESTLREG